MELTQEQIQTLRSYKTVMDDDNIRIKTIIKQTLIEDPLIIYLLNNKELEDDEADPSDYLDTNILSYYLIHPTQHNVANYICVGIDTTESPRFNDALKYQTITFYILCEEKNGIEPLTGLPVMIYWRQGLRTVLTGRISLARSVLVDERESVTDNDYATRTLKFQMTTPKNIVKTKDGASRVVNRIGG